MTTRTIKKKPTSQFTEWHMTLFNAFAQKNLVFHSTYKIELSELYAVYKRDLEEKQLHKFLDGLFFFF